MAVADGSRFEEVLDALGLAITGGALPAGSRLVLSDIEERHSVSRTLARDVIKVLESLGLATARRRAGIVIQDAGEWNVLDPSVIGWRLAGEGRAAQIASLTEVRSAVEPRAARLAAAHASSGQADQLVELAAAMTALGRRGLGRSDAYLDADIKFHTLLLHSGGNEMFSAMRGMVTDVLRGRSLHGLTPAWPDEVALTGHEAIARAIRAHDGDAAEAASRVSWPSSAPRSATATSLRTGRRLSRTATSGSARRPGRRSIRCRRP